MFVCCLTGGLPQSGVRLVCSVSVAQGRYIPYRPLLGRLDRDIGVVGDGLGLFCPVRAWDELLFDRQAVLFGDPDLGSPRVGLAAWERGIIAIEVGENTVKLFAT